MKSYLLFLGMLVFAHLSYCPIDCSNTVKQSFTKKNVCTFVIALCIVAIISTVGYFSINAGNSLSNGCNQMKIACNNCTRDLETAQKELEHLKNFSETIEPFLKKFPEYTNLVTAIIAKLKCTN